MGESASAAAPEPAIMKQTVGEALNEAKAKAGTHAASPRAPGIFPLDRDSAIFGEKGDGAWPKTVQEFKDGGYLEPGDVLVMTKLGSLFSSIVNIFDRADFAHCAMVYQTPHHEDGIDYTYLIETSFSGVDIRTLNEIVAPKKIYKDIKLPPDFVVGVKRLEADWATPPLRRMTASRMLHFIDNDDYDFSMLMALATRRTANWYFHMLRKLRGQSPTVAQYFTQGVKFSPAEFICSGFVQFAYVDMVRTGIERGMIPRERAEEAWGRVLFSDDLTGETSMKELMALKPGDLAQTPKLKWKYLINQGQVTKVETNEDVNNYFAKIKARHKRLRPAA